MLTRTNACEERQLDIQLGTVDGEEPNWDTVTEHEIHERWNRIINGFTLHGWFNRRWAVTSGVLMTDGIKMWAQEAAADFGIYLDIVECSDETVLNNVALRMITQSTYASRSARG